MSSTKKKRAVAKKKKKQPIQSHSSETVLFGAAAVALGAAGYYLFGPGGKDHQKKAKGWALKMKGDVVHRLEQLKKVDEPMYHEIVDTVTEEFQKTKAASQGEIRSLALSMKRAWNAIVTQAVDISSKNKRS